MSAIRSSTRYPSQPTSDLGRSPYRRKDHGTLPVPESCSEKPDSRCTTGSMHRAVVVSWGLHALACHGPLLQCLTFSAVSTLRDRVSNDRRLAPPPMPTDVADVADVRAGFDSFLRQICPWSPTTGVNSEPNGLPISDGRETVAARHRRELAELLASSRTSVAPSAGIVPAVEESLVTFITESSRFCRF
jgi:hypothetical protein